jgi:hypothetical protein
MGTFDVECWTCRKLATVEGPAPQFGIDLIAAAFAAGFLSYMQDSRVLVFCSEECAKKAKRKDGWFRKYRPKAVEDTMVKGG